MTKKNTKKDRSSNKWCPCGYKRRGKNHEQGDHHTKRKK